MINWRMLSIGLLISGVGNIFRTVQRSSWVQDNLVPVSQFFESISAVSLGMILIGIAIFGYALVWGRWIIGSVLAVLFTSGMFILVFWS